MVYERNLDEPPNQWNIAQDMFMFHESEDSDVVHVLKLRSDDCATLFEFKFPDNTVSRPLETVPVNQSIVADSFSIDDQNAALIKHSVISEKQA